jgi:hypothetical protein
MAKEVNKEVKKKLQHQCPTMKYYENTKYALNRKETKKIDTIVFHVSNTFTFCTDIPFATHFNCAEKKNPTFT